MIKVTRSPIAFSEWTAFSAPAAAARASASIAAAGAGVRRMLDSFVVSIVAVAAQGNLEVQVRDGATGAGTILWQFSVNAVIGTSQIIRFTGLNLIGTANTAMTVEFVAVPAAGNFERCSMAGANCL